MGEMAEYMVNGDDCQECGEYIGPGDGFPRSCAGCKPRTPPQSFGKGKYLRCTSRKRTTHIINPSTKRTYCQAENNAKLMFRSKEPEFAARMCKNCEAMDKAAAGKPAP